MRIRKLLMYGATAVLVAIGFWLGGYAYFTHSEEWHSAQELVSTSEIVSARVGKVQNISVSPFGFFYRFSGDSGDAKLTLTVRGTNGQAKFKAEMRMSRGTWVLVRLTEI